MNHLIEFAIVGAAWRADFFLRIARAIPDRFRVTGVVTANAQRSQHVKETYGVPVFASMADLLASPHRPLFVVTSVPRAANASVITTLVQAGHPVLSETPPAGTVAEMAQLHALTQSGGRIQVAEQYHLQPQHAARLAFVRSGKLGQITQAQVSAAHGYHGVSLMRLFLGVRFENARIRGLAFASPIIESRGREGHPAAERQKKSNQSIVTFEFGDKLGIYDFCGDEYFSYIRHRRVLIRGVRGELVNDQVTYLVDQHTPVTLEVRRHEAGPNGNLEGAHLKGIQIGESWYYRNRLAPARLFDDETAIAECLWRMADYVNGGEPFYPLGDACQDQYLALMAEQAVQTGQTVQTMTQPWAS